MMEKNKKQILVVADETKGLVLGAVDYITKPFNPHLLVQRIKTHMLLKEHRDHLEEKVHQQSRLIDITQDVTIEIAGKLAEYRDEETGEHIIRTKNYLRQKTHGLRPGHYHELSPASWPGFISVHCPKITYSHHEKWDGTGYPEGLKGNDIPLAGRLMALADVYDALISRRIYKPAFSHEKAVRIITEEKGTHFDPELVELFLSCEQQFHEIAETYADPPDEVPKGRYG